MIRADRTISERIDMTSSSGGLPVARGRVWQFRPRGACAFCRALLGDFGVVNALYKSLAMLGLERHKVAVISGIGCFDVLVISSSFPI